MFIVVLAVLSIVLAFQRSPMPEVSGLTGVGAAVTAAVLLPPVLAWWLNRRVLRHLDRHIDDSGPAQVAYEIGLLVSRIALGVAHLALLLFTGWLDLCGRLPVVGDWPLLPGIVASLPFLVSVTLTWTAFFPADRAIRQLGVEAHLFRGKPVRPVWSLPKYLVFNLRHQLLFIYIPMLLILLARDVIQQYQRELIEWAGHPFIADVLLGAAAAVVAVIAPMILRYVWTTERLPDGPLRDRLLRLCEKLPMRCREILVWRSGGMIVNAAVMGVVAPLRYVLITDGMLEQLDDVRIEAVFGHEAGHVKRHHIFFFLMFALISGCIITLTSSYERQWGQAWATPLTLAAGGLLIFQWGVVFGWMSRLFERQADLFGVRTLAVAGVPCHTPCQLHGAPRPVGYASPAGTMPAVGEAAVSSTASQEAEAPIVGSGAAVAVHRSSSPSGAADGSRPGESTRAPEKPRPGDPLCSTAAHIFGYTLNEVAALNGIRPAAFSWRHGSIAERSRAVLRYAADPLATAAFERRLRRVKLGILAVAMVLSAWTVVELQLWRLVGIGG